MTTELLLIATLATYRLTSMLNNEAGPADIFGRFRSLIGVKLDEYSVPYGTNWVAEGVLCFYCLSVWIGFGITTAILITAILGNVNVALWVLFPFAISGAAVFLKKYAG